MTVGDLFKDWMTDHAAVNLSEGYATEVVRWWDRGIATRPIARVRLARLADDPALITRFQDELARAGLSAASRVQVLKVSGRCCAGVDDDTRAHSRWNSPVCSSSPPSGASD